MECQVVSQVAQTRRKARQARMRMGRPSDATCYVGAGFPCLGGYPDVRGPGAPGGPHPFPDCHLFLFWSFRMFPYRGLGRNTARILGKWVSYEHSRPRAKLWSVSHLRSWRQCNTNYGGGKAHPESGLAHQDRRPLWPIAHSPAQVLLLSPLTKDSTMSPGRTDKDNSTVDRSRNSPLRSNVEL